MIHPLNASLGQGPSGIGHKSVPMHSEQQRNLSAQIQFSAFNPQLPLRLAGDASCYGIRAVLLHQYPDGSERPIAYTSRTLLPSERNYAQIEREALSLVFGIQKFHQFIYGRSFTLVTDHKPLTTILDRRKGIPTIAAVRMQRWGFLLSTYHYNIEFKLIKSHANADGLSRLPVPENSAVGNPQDVTLFNVSQIPFQ